MYINLISHPQENKQQFANKKEPNVKEYALVIRKRSTGQIRAYRRFLTNQHADNLKRELSDGIEYDNSDEYQLIEINEL